MGGFPQHGPPHFGHPHFGHPHFGWGPPHFGHPHFGHPHFGWGPPHGPWHHWQALTNETEPGADVAAAALVKSSSNLSSSNLSELVNFPPMGGFPQHGPPHFGHPHFGHPHFGWGPPHFGHPHFGHPHFGWGPPHGPWHHWQALTNETEQLADACEEVGDCCNAEGYGEMAPASVEAMMAMLNASAQSPIKSFFDLGSGIGRIVMHIAVKGYANLSTGVEMNKARHAFAAELAQAALPQGMPHAAGAVGEASNHSVASGVQLLQGDMLGANLTSATVLYMNPACLSCSTKRRLVQKILEECQDLRYILTTYPLPGIAGSDAFVELKTESLSPMIGYDWQIPVTLYEKKASAGRKHLRR